MTHSAQNKNTQIHTNTNTNTNANAQIQIQTGTVADKKNVAFSSLKSHALHSRNPIQHQKQIQQAYAEKYCWIKLFEDDALIYVTRWRY